MELAFTVFGCIYIEREIAYIAVGAIALGDIQA